ncbi:MAG: c-type cytochrome [Anaerolineales bacterium]|jgi:mono/diheme cytochrome c family protein
MKEENKKSIQEKYKLALQKGERFWPDSIYKDLLISLAIFIVLILLASFLGVPTEPKANPNDTAYIPRPEWYFLFLFQMLKYFPGKLEWLGTTIIPGIAILVLLLLPILDRNQKRHYSARKIALTVMGVVVVGIVGLTVLAAVTTPPQEPLAAAGTIPQQISVGQDLFSLNCAQCHGADGKVTEITGVKGLEGKQIIAINSSDVMYTLDDTALADIISYGRPESGMTPFGQPYGGSLSPTEIEEIATFMRYSWDNRAVLPPGTTLGTGIPALKPGEVPSYDVHIGPLTKRFCISCHQPSKENNNYLMTSYTEMLNSGDNAPVMAAGDSKSLLLKLITGHEGVDPKTGQTIRQMPPTKLLDQQYIDMLTRWIMAGMPQTAKDAAKLSPTPTTTPASTPTP